MGMTRRELLASACRTLPALMLAGCAGNSIYSKKSVGESVRDGLRPRRLAIAMWDFSWFYQHHPGGYYENFDKVLGELVERGFNTVRIDAFPLIISNLKAEDEKVTPIVSPLENWGHVPEAYRHYSHALVPELIDFMSAARRRGVGVILSSWGQRCAEYPNARDQHGSPEKLASAWTRTLGILRREGLLDHVRYVDLDQEFPSFSPFENKLQQLGAAKDPVAASDGAAMEGAVRKLHWNSSQLAFVKNTMERTIDLVHEQFPDLRLTFSLTANWDEVRSLRIANFGVLELHFWIHDTEFDRTGFADLVKNRDPKNDYKAYMAAINEVMAQHRPAMLQQMEAKIQNACRWASEWNIPLTTTEAWGPWWHMDHPDLDWQWLYDWCEDCMKLAGRYSLWGATPWNYCHPYWKNWENVAWYRKVNRSFLKS